MDRRPRFVRKARTREIHKRLLIVCEGAKTEPNYFRAFPAPPELKVVVDGAGCETVRVVERAIELRNKSRRSAPFDEVWCVFDRDDFPIGRFNAALELARCENIRVAYSIEAFEIWYLLHFHYYNTAISRSDYGRLLSGHLGYTYQKNVASIYEELEPKIGTAIKYAKKLHDTQEQACPGVYDRNPDTTVYELVEELRSYRRD